ncbi:MAG: hypothetical protein NVSMB57_15240 [Actinomycetota bacterium]
MNQKRSFVCAATVICAIAAFLVFASGFAWAAEGASPSASASALPAKAPGPPIPYYASYGLVALVGLTILGLIAAYLFQAPGFRRSSRGTE